MFPSSTLRALCAFWGFLAVTVHELKLTLTFNIPFIDFDILSPLKQLDQKRIHLMCNDETKAAGCAYLKEHWSSIGTAHSCITTVTLYTSFFFYHFKVLTKDRWRTMDSTGTQLKNAFAVPTASVLCWVVHSCQSRVRSSAHGPAVPAR